MAYIKNEKVIVFNKDKGVVEEDQSDENVLVKITLTDVTTSYHKDDVEYDLTQDDTTGFMKMP